MLRLSQGTVSGRQEGTLVLHQDSLKPVGENDYENICRAGRSHWRDWYIDWRGDRNVGTALLPVAGVHGFCFDFHLRFQRIPSLVSSRMTPRSSSSARISSDRWKFFVFLA